MRIPNSIFTVYHTLSEFGKAFPHHLRTFHLPLQPDSAKQIAVSKRHLPLSSKPPTLHYPYRKGTEIQPVEQEDLQFTDIRQ